MAKIHVERMMHRSSIAVAGESAATYALIKLIPSGGGGVPMGLNIALGDLDEKAQALFEQAQFRQAMALLINLAGDFPTDVPTMNLLQRSMALFQNPPAKFDPVWHLKAKTA